jgi:hypothetical protein
VPRPVPIGRHPGATLQNTAICPAAPPPDTARAAGQSHSTQDTVIRPGPTRARSRTTASIPDRAHTDGSGGSNLGMAVLVVLGAAFAVRLAGPVLAAAAEVVYVVGIVVAATAGGAAVAVLVAQAWRWRRQRLDAARAEVLTALLPLRAAQPLPALAACDGAAPRGPPAPARRERSRAGRHHPPAAGGAINRGPAGTGLHSRP